MPVVLFITPNRLNISVRCKSNLVLRNMLFQIVYRFTPFMPTFGMLDKYKIGRVHTHPVVTCVTLPNMGPSSPKWSLSDWDSSH